MNFLGHTYFNLGSDATLAGNFFGDYVKGNPNNLSLPENIKKGVRWHRYLDEGCNQSAGFRKMKENLNGDYPHMKGVIIDVFIDHLLAIHWKDFAEVDLLEFTMNVYTRIVKHREFFPPRFEAFFDRMVEHNWLYHNKEVETMDRILASLERRSSVPFALQPAVRDLKNKEVKWKEPFYLFMDEMRSWVDKGASGF